MPRSKCVNLNNVGRLLSHNRNTSNRDSARYIRISRDQITCPRYGDAGGGVARQSKALRTRAPDRRTTSALAQRYGRHCKGLCHYRLQCQRSPELDLPPCRAATAAPCAHSQVSSPYPAHKSSTAPPYRDQPIQRRGSASGNTKLSRATAFPSMLNSRKGTASLARRQAQHSCVHEPRAARPSHSEAGLHRR